MNFEMPELGEKLINKYEESHITDIILRHLSLVAEKISDSEEEIED